MENAMNIIENLSEELGEKELRIIELEKQVEEIKKEKDYMNKEILARKMFSKRYLLNILYECPISEVYEEIDKELVCRHYASNGLFDCSQDYKDMFTIICRDVLELEDFELLEDYQLVEQFKSEIPLREFILNVCDGDEEEGTIRWNRMIDYCEWEDICEELNDLTDFSYQKAFVDKGSIIFAKCMC